MIDIIIPVYNSQNTIGKTLDSIVLQSIKDLVIVNIIDDGSIDNYDEIIKSYKDVININFYKLPKNMGPGYARQFGVEHSNGKYIMFIDSDDVLYDANSLKSIYETIESENYDVVYSQMREDYFGEVYDFYVGFDVLHSKIYSRDFIEKNNIRFPELYNSEDLAFNNLVIMNDPSIGCCDDMVYVYCRRENSLTQTDDYTKSKHIKCYCESLNWTLKYAEEQGIAKEMIGKLILSSMSYLAWYFQDKQNDENKEYVYSLISYYDKYAFYTKDTNELYWLDFWTIRVKDEGLVECFISFINECRKHYYCS